MRNPLLDPAARLVIAHRGNSMHAPENTLLSLDQAVQLGADAIEFDVRLTRDGVPVIMHDPDLGRTTNGHGALRELTFAELRSLAVRPRPGTAGGPRLEVPSLEEVLDRFRETALVIEVKEPAACYATERLVRSFGAEKRAIIGSSNAAVMRHFYGSGLHTCASTMDALRMLPAALLGLTPGVPPYNVLSVTPRYAGLPVPILRLAAAARQAGIATQVWTVNVAGTARALWLGGVAGIVTDDPGALLRVRPE